MPVHRESRVRINRRALLKRAAGFGGTALLLPRHTFAQAPGVVTAEAERPKIPLGVMSGDPTGGRAVIWSKTDRPARMLVEYATREDFAGASRVEGPAALPVTDYTARVDLQGLPAGADIFYRVTFRDLADPKKLSTPAGGRLRMPRAPRDHLRLFRRRGGAGLGHQPGMGRLSHLRDDAASFA